MGRRVCLQTKTPKTKKVNKICTTIAWMSRALYYYYCYAYYYTIIECTVWRGRFIRIRIIIYFYYIFLLHYYYNNIILYRRERYDQRSLFRSVFRETTAADAFASRVGPFRRIRFTSVKNSISTAAVVSPNKPNDNDNKKKNRIKKYCSSFVVYSILYGYVNIIIIIIIYYIFHYNMYIYYFIM